jgi:ABC-type multidrug transport system fused ATPase/permease subunit
MAAKLGAMLSSNWKKRLTPAKPQDIQKEAERAPHIPHLVWKEVVDTDTPVLLAVLDSLTFDQMDFRRSKIREAHPNTFSWMFYEHFRAWLKSPEPVYWISGKPGSGKSTLVKYLVDNPEIPIQLRQWYGS